MYNSKNKILHSIYALFLAAVFMSTFLIKPLHIIIAHHDSHDFAIVHSERATVSTAGESNCPICDFEFCSFVSADKIDIQKTPECFADNFTPQTIDCQIQKSSHNFLLRAPPAL